MGLCAELINPFFSKWDWMDRQIAADFKNARKFTREEIEAAYAKLPKGLVERYEIKGGIVYGPKNKMTQILQEIIKRYPTPDVVFLFSLLDVIRLDILRYFAVDVPIFSVIKAPMTDGKIIHFIDCNEKAVSQLDAMWEQIDQIRPLVPWKEKKPRLFWRGEVADRYGQGDWHDDLSTFPRGILVLNGARMPEVIDAKFNRLANPSIQTIFPFVPKDALKQHLLYKFQIVLDGETISSSELQWKLFSGCLTLKQDSDETFWFSAALNPWQHYMPLQRDLADLEETITWLLRHDNEAEQIANNAYEFARENLALEPMLIYGYKALLMYSLFFQ